jgi:hypothetical protein
VLYHQAPQSRSHIAYLLWPDTTDAQALSNFRTLVHRLPPQQCLPDAVAKLLDAAIKAWDTDQRSTARTQLKLITKQAETLGYL